MTAHTPTAEQQAVVDTYHQDKAMVIQAGAGTGKTTTLRTVAESTSDRVQYVAFNRSIVDEASRTFPDNASVRTMHSLAYRPTVTPDFARRLRGPRMKGDHMARILGIGPLNVTYGQQKKVLQPGYLAGQVMKGIDRYCDSADERPGVQHLPYIDGIDVPDEGGKRTYENNDKVRAELAPYLDAVWADVTNTTGRLPFKHQHYLKMWERSRPRINADALVVDEAQDLNPVMLSICEQQADHLQLVAVGDSQQSIYGWRGAVDALERFDVDATLYLTQSFRFGPAIADVANAILTQLDAELRLSGLDSIPSSVERLAQPRCWLTRTNALAVSTLITEQTAGRAAFLIGGGQDVLRFVQAVVELQAKGYTSHPDLACFTSWNEVQAYVADDPSGDDLALLVRLIQDHGADEILAALQRMPADEHKAEVVISTAHKAKGREWDTVRLGADFRDPKDGGELSAEEWRLLYVASTRAQRVLDPHEAAPLARLLGIAGPADGPAAVKVATGGTASVHSSALPGGGGAAAPAVLPAAKVAAPVAPAAAPFATETAPDEPVTALPSSGTPRQAHGAASAVRQPTWAPGPADVEGKPVQWLIGRCGPGCRYGCKLQGILVIADHKFRGVYNPDGSRVNVPRCPEHGKRPWLRVLNVLPPDGSRCNSSCQHAFKDECACACQGENHGKAHLVSFTQEVTS
jgi:hypothetical protein